MIGYHVTVTAKGPLPLSRLPRLPALPALGIALLAMTGPGAAENVPTNAATNAPENALAVRAITAEFTTPISQHVLVGEITAPETVQASFAVGGRVTEVEVQVGDKVKKGQVLARIEQVQQVQAQRAAEAELSAAEAEYTAAKSQSDRQSELFERGATTRSDRDSAADRLAAAEAMKAQAQASLDQARQALDDTVLQAPADATITDRFGEPGQVVGAAQPVLELAVGPGYEAKFDVPETILTTIGQVPPLVTLSSIDRPKLTVTGQVKEVSPLVDPARGTVEVTVTLDDPVPGLTYGDAVRGSTVSNDTAHIVVPWSSISSGTSGPTVWVVSPTDQTVSERPITVARYIEHEILVEDGLVAGEIVVTRGAQLLYPGREVHILEPGE